ncbi:MAG: hypothetical protein QM786_11975 [Breznakibacter sp.]
MKLANIFSSLIVAGSLISTAVTAQNSSSPYSMFGLGSFNQSGDIRSAGMGGAGIALASSYGPNTTNPASLSYLDSMLFYINIQAKGNFANYATSSKTQSTFDSNFDQISFGFKAARWWGTSFGVSAISQSNYSIWSEKYILGSLNKYDVLYEGDGGLSKAYWSNSWKVLKGLSAGLNLSIVWGNLTSTETSTFTYLGGESISNIKTYHLNNFVWDAGLHYQFKMKENNVSLGATYQPKTALLTDFSQEITGNSTYYTSDNSASDYELPETFGAGLGVNVLKKSLTFAADFRLERWSKASNPIKYAQLNDAYRVAAGVEYQPQKNMYRSIFNRMMYRAGAFMGDTYLTINGQTIFQQGFSAGLGIPLRQRRNYINLSYQYSISGTKKAGLIEETNHAFKIGLSLSENWFFKSTFE